MDVLTLGDKKYVKANVIARDLGYTADYVGQLCRSGKVDATLVGRSWYVNKDSIHSHKSGRYRSTKSKTVQELRSLIRVDESEPVNISHFYTHHTHRPNESARYTPDTSELIPQLASGKKKAGNLEVGLADASGIEVHSSEEQYTFKTPKLPHVQFKGSLKVSNYGEDEEERKEEPSVAPKGGVLLHPKQVEALTSEKKPKKIAISDKPDDEHEAIVTKPTFVNRLSHRETSVDPTLDKAAKAVSVSNEPIPQSTTSYRVLLVVVFLFALALSFLLNSLDTYVVASASSFTSTIQMSISNFSATAHQLFDLYHQFQL